MFGRDKKAKVVLKTAKGGGPIRKVKFAIGASALAVIIRPFVEPAIRYFVGDVPDGAVLAIAEAAIELKDVVLILVPSVASYFARPGSDDGPVVVSEG